MTRSIVLAPDNGNIAPITETMADGLGLYLWSGMLVLFVLVAVVGGWAVNARLDGAVVVPGTFTVESNRKTVQHLEGGIVGEILVSEGDTVRAGQPLLRLDSTIDRANLGVVESQLDELLARRARLLSEIAGGDTVAFPADLLDRGGDPAVAAILAGQRELFAARRASRTGQVGLIRQRIIRFEEEIAGLTAQRVSNLKEIALVDRELAGLRDLYEKGYATLPRLLALERQAERIRGDVAEHDAGIARARNGIGELKLELVQIEHDQDEVNTAELRQIEPQIAALRERRIAAAERLERGIVVAPDDGVVVGMQVNTVGGVLRPGDAILDLVPAGEDLVIEARVPAADVDRVRAGQESRVRLSAFDQATTPEVSGTVIAVSADSFADDVTGARYYNARIRLGAKDESDGAQASGIELVPGMPAEVFIQTGSRTALSYFVRPLTDRLSRAFVEG